MYERLDGLKTENMFILGWAQISPYQFRLVLENIENRTEFSQPPRQLTSTTKLKN